MCATDIGSISNIRVFLLPTILLTGFFSLYSAGFKAIKGLLGALGCIIVAVKGIGSVDGNDSAMKITRYGGDMAATFQARILPKKKPPDSG